MLSKKDLELLRSGINDCTVYIIHSADDGITDYYFGGAYLIDISDDKYIKFVKDYLREWYKIKLPVKCIESVMYNGKLLDIVLTSGCKITGVNFPKISSSKISFAKGKFNDSRVIYRARDNVWVVDMPSIIPDAKDLISPRSIMMPKVLENYLEPLTYAFIVNDDDIKITYWDSINLKLLDRYWVSNYLYSDIAMFTDNSKDNVPYIKLSKKH